MRVRGRRLLALETWPSVKVMRRACAAAKLGGPEVEALLARYAAARKALERRVLENDKAEGRA